jgi:enamine deaminase RidA (YjgF/YER057c/UK114 family)
MNKRIVADGFEILQPPTWPRPKGYSNGVAARGGQIFVAGQIGWDAAGLSGPGSRLQTETPELRGARTGSTHTAAVIIAGPRACMRSIDVL